VTSIDIHLQRPHAGQRQVIEGARRFNVVCCGRRFGKTQLGGDRVIHEMLKGRSVGWFAPGYKYTGPVWRELVDKLYPLTTDVSQQDKRIEIHGGGVLEMWTLDSPDAGRGRAYSTVVIDEAAMVQNFESAWQQSLRPMLTDYKGGAWFFSTPKGTASYFHTLFQRGQDGTQEEWASFQMPTITNPYIDAGEIESARQDLTDLAFAQEYLAQFVSWTGAVFRRITDAIAPSPSSAATLIGVDWGRTNDYTVFVALSQSGQVVAIDRFRGLEYTLQRERLRAFWERHGSIAWIIAESNSMGMPIIEELQRDRALVINRRSAVIPFQTTNASKAEAVEGLALAFERGTIKIIDDPVLIGELQAFEARPLPSGMMRYCAPEGQHDDCVMALAMAWAGRVGQEPSKQAPQVMSALSRVSISRY
jgi:hypothetical protein